MRSSKTYYQKISFTLSIVICIQLLMILGCKEDPLPVVAFSAERKNVLEGDTIHFSDETLNDPTSWLWSFGDGNTNTEQSPAHLYSSAGTYTVNLTATNDNGSNSLEEADFITIIETGKLTDDRDGNSYRTVEIGQQVWMAENLKYLPGVNSLSDHSYTNPMYYVYNYDGSDVNAAMAVEEYSTYGVLYNWPAAMNGEQSNLSNPSGVQGVCPAGWHLPSIAEWRELRDHLGGSDIAGGKLKEEGLSHWGYPNGGATNESGFTALPGGVFIAYTGLGDPYETPSFALLGEQGAFSTTSKVNDNTAYYFYLKHDSNESTIGNGGGSKGWGLSIRCIQDE